jgi:ribosomal protein S18 acetylase RimI-like enzyme
VTVAAVSYVVRELDGRELDYLLQYLADQLTDNGIGETALFQPEERGPFPYARKRAEFGMAMATPVGSSDWRRFWIAERMDGPQILGHVDLRSSDPLAAASHWARLGMGVHREHRRRGIGRALLQHALSWAEAQPGLAWVDLSFLAGNAAAESLYRSVGFHEMGRMEDRFRVGGRSVADVLMAKRLQSRP